MRVNFYLKDKWSQVPTTVFARMCYNYNSVKVYTDLRIMPDMWDPQAQKAKGEMIGAWEFNTVIARYREKIQRCLNRYLNASRGELPDRGTFQRLLAAEFRKKLLLENSIITWAGYRSTIIQLKNFQEALQEYPESEENVHPVIHQAGKDAIKYKIRVFTMALKDFEVRHPEIKIKTNRIQEKNDKSC